MISKWTRLDFADGTTGFIADGIGACIEVKLMVQSNFDKSAWHYIAWSEAGQETIVDTELDPKFKGYKTSDEAIKTVSSWFDQWDCI